MKVLFVAWLAACLTPSPWKSSSLKIAVEATAADQDAIFKSTEEEEDDERMMLEQQQAWQVLQVEEVPEEKQDYEGSFIVSAQKRLRGQEPHAVMYESVPQDALVGPLQNTSRRRFRTLKDKTGVMFEETSSSVSSSKEPKSCKSSKAPKKIKANYEGEGILSCTEGASAAPSMVPSQSVLPSVAPSQSNLPSVAPSQSDKPSFSPSISNVPSSMPSKYLYYGCFDPKIPETFQCFTGNADYVTRRCYETNSNCCRGFSCANFKGVATVCSGSCNRGTGNGPSCAGIGAGAYIGPASCNGALACDDLGAGAHVGPASCNGVLACDSLRAGAVIEGASCSGVAACQGLGSSAPPGGVRVKAKSCNCDSACKLVAKRVVNGPVLIGSNSCNGPFACFQAGYKALYINIGDNSCSSRFSCDSRYYMEYIGDNSCQGFQSCRTIGSFTAKVRIGSDSCNPNQACTAFATTAGGSVSIGNSTCNTNVSQCSGLLSAGGTVECRYGTGVYGTSLPNGATQC